MPLTSLLKLSSLAIVASAATIQRRDVVSQLSILNTSLPASTSPYDPHFFTLYWELPDQPLIEKDTYLLALDALQYLAYLPWSDAPFEGCSFHEPESKDPTIVIAMEGYNHFTVKHAMWGLVEAMSHIIERDFASVDAMLYYDYGRGIGPKRVGEIRFRDPHNHRSGQMRTLLGSSLNQSTQLNASTLGIGDIGVVGNRDVRILTEFQEAPVSKKGVFTAVYGSIVGLASQNRLRPLSTAARIECNSVKLEFQPWELPPRVPFVDYMTLVYTLASLPKKMYIGGFLGGRFVLEIGDHPAACGYIQRGAGGNLAVA